MRFPAPSRLFVAALIALAAGGAGAWWRLRSLVGEALRSEPSTTRPLTFVSLATASPPLEHWGGGEVEGIALTPAGFVTAGGSGVEDESGRFQGGLPTLRASAIAAWRGRSVVGLTAGGLFRRGDSGWEEMRTGFGALHVRCLEETAGGELLIGAREGLFRAAWGAAVLERLDGHPVRSLAMAGAAIVAGGEDQLRLVETGRTTVVKTRDPWIETVALLGHDLVAVTATGLERGALGSGLAPVAGGEDVVSGVAHEGAFYALTEAPATVRRFETAGRSIEVVLPATPRRLMTAGGSLFVDTEAGLYRREPGGFGRIRSPNESLPAGPSHVTALATLGETIVAGLFDGGLAVAERRGGHLRWRSIEGSAAWGVNALLPAGGVLYVASLRGAARFDGARLTPLDGPGAAFSLAATSDGVAIGYAQGVLLPGQRLLSAFHGLPGNQALALAAGQGLFVGTPSGLGDVEARRVAWRVVAGEGKLPHPWVTALQVSGDKLLIGTYGGGLTRRSAAGRFEPFVETEGLKVNTGCLALWQGRFYAGTDGRGLWRTSAEGGRFEPLPLALPSPRVTALLPDGDSLFVGTDEGVARVGGSAR
jgi:hypothetical protein